MRVPNSPQLQPSCLNEAAPGRSCHITNIDDLVQPVDERCCPLTRGFLIEGRSDETSNFVSAPPIISAAPGSHPQSPVVSGIQHINNHLFHLSSASVVIKVQHEVFRVPRFCFATAGTEADDWLDGGLLDSDGNVDLEMEDVSPSELESFFSVLFESMFFGSTPTTKEAWTGTLKLAHRWGFASIKQRAILELTSLTSPVDKIVLSHQYDIDIWLFNAYKQICEESACLSLDDCRRLSADDMYRIGFARQAIREPAGLLDHRASILRAIFSGNPEDDLGSGNFSYPGSPASAPTNISSTSPCIEMLQMPPTAETLPVPMRELPIVANAEIVVPHPISPRNNDDMLLSSVSVKGKNSKNGTTMEPKPELAPRAQPLKKRTVDLTSELGPAHVEEFPSAEGEWITSATFTDTKDEENKQNSSVAWDQLEDSATEQPPPACIKPELSVQPVAEDKGKIFEGELAKALEPHVAQEGEGRFRCQRCQKLFKAMPYVEKHVANKHPELLESPDELPDISDFALESMSEIKTNNVQPSMSCLHTYSLSPLSSSEVCAWGTAAADDEPQEPSYDSDINEEYSQSEDRLDSNAESTADDCFMSWAQDMKQIRLGRGYEDDI